MDSEILIKRGVLRRGHFLLSSGLHSDEYFEKFRILEDPKFAAELVREKIEDLKKLEADAVVGPTLGGVLVAYEVASQLGLRAVYAEKKDEKRVIRRGFYFPKGIRVIIADDVLTTGKSIRETFKCVVDMGGHVVGAFVLIDRSDGVEFPFPLISVFKFRAKTYEASNCPLCRRGVPLEIPGGSKAP
jgi:orotate phosphoribosyltransferase